MVCPNLYSWRPVIPIAVKIEALLMTFTLIFCCFARSMISTWVVALKGSPITKNETTLDFACFRIVASAWLSTRFLSAKMIFFL